MVGVTVDTAILAGIIKAEINACHAAAFQTLVFVFDCIDRTAKQSGNEFTVNTVGMCNLPAGQIDVFGAGVYFQPAGMSRRSKTLLRWSSFVQKTVRGGFPFLLRL